MVGEDIILDHGPGVNGDVDLNLDVLADHNAAGNEDVLSEDAIRAGLRIFSYRTSWSWRGRLALASRGHLGLATERREQDALGTEEQGRDALATEESSPKPSAHPLVNGPTIGKLRLPLPPGRNIQHIFTHISFSWRVLVHRILEYLFELGGQDAPVELPLGQDAGVLTHLAAQSGVLQ